jgi:hypothetical protein
MKTALIAIGLALGCCFVITATAAAQGPVRSDTLYAGAYRLRIDLYSDPPFTGRRYEFDVLLGADTPAALQGLSLNASALPEPATNATPVAAVMTPAGAPGAFKGYVTMPVRGAWRLRFVLGGSGAGNHVDLPLQVAAPTAIPIWSAWAIALAPLLGLLMFALQQRSYLAQLQRPPVAATPAASVHAVT